MASQLTLNASLAYEDADGSSDSLQIVDRLVTITGKQFVKHKQSIGFAGEEAIALGEITAPTWALFVNRDITNYVELKVATSGAIFARLDPDTQQDGTGGFCLLKLGSGAQAPFAVANTAACLIEYFLALA